MSALKNEACFPQFTAADLLVSISPGVAAAHTIRLRSANFSKLFDTDVWLHVDVSEDVHCRVAVKYEFDGPALQYNIFAILILTDSNVFKFKDFTESCQNMPAGLDPGNELALFVGQLPNVEKLHVIVFGQSVSEVMLVSPVVVRGA